MPELLLDLEAATPGAQRIEALDRATHRIVADISEAVTALRGTAAIFKSTWERLVLGVAQGRTAEAHAARERLSSFFDKRLELLRITHALAASLRELGRDEVADPAVLKSEIAAMERLKLAVFDPWRTAEDLEDLAARDYPLSTADLDKIGPQHQPPPAFYAEDGKPF